MFVEIALLFLALLILFNIKKRWIGWSAAAMVVAGFCFIHQMLFPLGIAFGYMLSLFLVGDALRKGIGLKDQGGGRIAFSFLFGFGIEISLVALLSRFVVTVRRFYGDAGWFLHCWG